MWEWTRVNEEVSNHSGRWWVTSKDTGGLARTQATEALQIEWRSKRARSRKQTAPPITAPAKKKKTSSEFKRESVASSAIKSQEVGYFSELSQHRVLNLLISSSPSYFSIQTNLFQHRVLKSFNSQSRRVQYSSVPEF